MNAPTTVEGVVQIHAEMAAKMNLARHQVIRDSLDSMGDIAPELNDFPAFEELKTQVDALIDLLGVWT